METNEEFDNARKRAKAAKQAFEKIKNDRHKKFMECYDHVAGSIDATYKVHYFSHLHNFKIPVHNLDLINENCRL